MVKILHLIGEFDEDEGGAQRVILNIINSCDKSAFQMGVCSLFGEATLSRHLPSEVFNVNFNYSNRYNPKIFTNTYEFISKWKPDILHVHSSVAGIFGRPLAKMLGIMLISTVHNDVRNTPTRNKLIDKFTLGFSDSIVCVSELAEESIKKVYGDSVFKNSDIIVIPNCIDCSKLRGKIQSDPQNKINTLGLAEASYIVGTVGRLHPLKGQKYLIKAWANVVDSHPDAVLLIVGDGKEMRALQNLVEDLRLGKSIYFLGARNDVPDILNILDIFVFPTLSEGFGVALLEAMCMEKIIVASEIEPLKTVLGDCGTYFKPKDQANIANKLKMILDNPKPFKKLGKEAGERVRKKFGPNEFGKKYTNVYQEVIQSVN
jgi:glycosyltransferase involved in cell wall biosynthesis